MDDADGLNDQYTPPEGLAATAASRLSAGRQQWRGHEGSQTDLAGWDQFDDGGPPKHHLWAAHSRPSTGLVYMQARYYDPEVGRFTQWDPMPYGPEMAWGQNNRWTYCANDPVDFSDPSGNSIEGALFVIGMAIGMGVGAYMGAEGALGGQGTFGGQAQWGLVGLLCSLLGSGLSEGCAAGTLLGDFWAGMASLFGMGVVDMLMTMGWYGLVLAAGIFVGMCIGLVVGAAVTTAFKGMGLI